MPRTRPFDYALMVTTICFVDDIETSFQEAWRVLRTEGVFAVGFVRRTRVLQTVFGRLSEITSVQEPREGHGEGGFVVASGRKAG